MDDPIFLPGGRDARGTLDVAGASTDGASSAPEGDDATPAEACVVACPPHPQHGGDRSDRRLQAVSSELTADGADCLRFDYGPWDGGRGERTDALHAVEWAAQRYRRVGLFGYSFGGAVAIAAAARGADVVAVAALAPPARVGSVREDHSGDIGGIDTVTDLASLPESLPLGIFYGTRDDIADVGPVVDRARERGATVRKYSADHFFVGREREVGAAVVEFLRPALRGETG